MKQQGIVLATLRNPKRSRIGRLRLGNRGALPGRRHVPRARAPKAGLSKLAPFPALMAIIKYRLDLMRRAMEILFEGKSTFPCCWTYIACESLG